MDRSSARLTHPGSSPFPGERRRRVRQKLHSPVFVSFNGPQSSMVLDLSELLDLTEDGFSVQTSGPLHELGKDPSQFDVNHPLTLCLDLPETKSYVHGSGLVVWRDDAGRAGVRFSFLTDRALSTLKEWLFVNLLIACSNHAARTEQLARRETPSVADPQVEEAIGEPAWQPVEQPVNDRAVNERPVLLPTLVAPAVSGTKSQAALDAIRLEIREIEARAIETGEDSTGAILQFITEQAAALTRASGSALALLTGERMLCRARAGDPAPPLGSEVNVTEGLSGECVRLGTTVSCEDTASDPRVDAELCRALGLGSFLATPIVSGAQVVGLLEVFSPSPHAFSKEASTVLEGLATLVPAQRNGERMSNEPPTTERPTTESTTDEDLLVMEAGAFSPAHTEPAESALITEPPLSEHSRTEHPSVDQVSPHPTAPESAASGPAPVETPSAQDAQAPGYQSNELRSFDPKLEEQTAIKQDAATSPAAAVLPPSSNQADALDSLREALWDHTPRLESAIDAEHPEGLPDPESKLNNWLTANFGILFSTQGLLFLAVLCAVALALGYLVARPFERHFVRKGSEQPSATVPVSLSSSKPRPHTPEEVRKLAEQGDADAQWQLGTIYHLGEGVPQNDRQAVEWFQRAADQGHVPALRALGSAYWGGRGVPQDFSQAYFWFVLALAEGDTESKSRLDGLSTQMTQAQVATARQQAEVWLHAHNQSSRSISN